MEITFKLSPQIPKYKYHCKISNQINFSSETFNKYYQCSNYHKAAKHILPAFNLFRYITFPVWKYTTIVSFKLSSWNLFSGISFVSINITRIHWTIFPNLRRSYIKTPSSSKYEPVLIPHFGSFSFV